MAFDEAAIQRVLDEADIRAVTMRYGRGCDRLDFDLVRSCFTDDALVDYGFYQGPVDGFIELIRPLLSNDTATTHQMCNQEFDHVSPQLVFVETMAIARHRQPPRDGAPLRDAIAYGTYCDRFENRDGDWRIAERLLLLSPGRLDPVVEDFPLPENGRLVPRVPGGILHPGDPPPAII
jgi:hypothetical protein